MAFPPINRAPGPSAAQDERCGDRADDYTSLRQVITVPQKDQHRLVSLNHAPGRGQGRVAVRSYVTSASLKKLLADRTDVAHQAAECPRG